jgi:RNA polymerase sigma-70 factor (ECF subfamily)
VKEAGTDDAAARPDPASGQLLEQVYDQLRAIARSRLNSEASNHTLQATALVHEVWLKLCNRGSVMALDRPRFVMAAAEAMRRVLIDHSRSKDRVKRGGGVSRRSTTDLGDILDFATVQDPEQIVALDRAICRLGQEYPKSCDVVKLRFFAGLSVEEAATCLGISDRTVKREWKFARAWLFRALS